MPATEQVNEESRLKDTPEGKLLTHVMLEVCCRFPEGKMPTCESCGLGRADLIMEIAQEAMRRGATHFLNRVGENWEYAPAKKEMTPLAECVQAIISDCLSGKDQDWLPNRVRARIQILLNLQRATPSPAPSSLERDWRKISEELLVANKRVQDLTTELAAEVLKNVS